MKLSRQFALLACLGLAAGGVALTNANGYGFVSAAYAKNGGNGGNGGGNGHSSSEHDASADAHDKTEPEDGGSNTGKLGALNAAHTSARARARANPNSAVGKIAAYEKSREAALAIQDPVAQEQALDAAELKLAADFGRPALPESEISKVNALLDARR